MNDLWSVFPDGPYLSEEQIADADLVFASLVDDQPDEEGIAALKRLLVRLSDVEERLDDVADSAFERDLRGLKP